MVRRVSSISNGDEWGKDPSVRVMRQVFHRVEVAQEEVLTGLSISPFDPRLRGWREAALELFEQAWSKASRRGLFVGEEEAAALYVQCLLWILVKDGVTGAARIISEDERIKRLLEEVIP
jgi:hypothetical protein